MVFMRAGFEAIDVHMSDLLSGVDQLDNYQGIVACGGFSYGDVLGAKVGGVDIGPQCFSTARPGGIPEEGEEIEMVEKHTGKCRPTFARDRNKDC